MENTTTKTTPKGPDVREFLRSVAEEMSSEDGCTDCIVVLRRKTPEITVRTLLSSPEMLEFDRDLSQLIFQRFNQ